MKTSEKPNVAIILASNLYNAPYVRYYTEILDRLDIPYDVISWNRLGVEETAVQALTLKESKSRPGRIIDYLRYRRFVKEKLANGNYDKVVVFTIFNTLLLLPFLKARYRYNFVFDIRDYSVALKCFRTRFTAAIQNAALVVISSHGFKRWLPKDHEYVIRHNTNEFEPFEMQASIKGQTQSRILTIGSLRDPEANKKLIQELADLPDYEMSFVGSGPTELILKQYVARQGIQNVSFQGRYKKQDEPKHLQGTSFINILTHEDINSMTLMSNRFYLSAVYGIPMIVNSGTEQAKWAERYNLGVVIDKKSGIKEQIIQYLRTFDRETFDAGRRAYLHTVQQDTEVFEARFKTFLEQ